MKTILINTKDFVSDIEVLTKLVENFPHSYFAILKKPENKIVYDHIMQNTQFLSKSAKLGIRIYCYVNGITELPKCKYCHKQLTEKHFRGFSTGFAQYCDNNCSNKSPEKQEKIKNIFLERFGTTTPLNNKELREKGKKTKLEKYGDENYTNREKAMQTCIDNYGVDNPFKSEIVKDRIRQTNLERYGVENVTQNLEIRNKQHQTMLDRFGKDNINNREKAIQTFSSHTDEQRKDIHDRTVATNLERYGVENVFSSGGIGREKAKKTCKDKYDDENYNNREKAAQTSLERYGETSYTKTEMFRQQLKDCNEERMEKQYNTKKARNSFSYSKEELIAYELLVENFDVVKRQYKCKRYPFKCDFYIPSIDTFIEYNGIWTHGNHPYDSQNAEDIKRLEEMRAKAENSEYYRSAINTWTIADPLKRNTAKTNNLKYIECWNLDDIRDFIHSSSSSK